MTTHTLPRAGRGSFATELGASTRAGLSSGLSLGADPGLGAELAYRRERALAIAEARRTRRDTRGRRTARRAVARDHADDGGTGHGRVTRWTSWLPSVPRHRSSAAAPN